MELIVAHKLEILGILFLLSEILASVPAIKANSIFQLAVAIIKKMAGK
jgi:hypothetical protein